MKIISSFHYNNIIAKEASGLSSVIRHMIDGGSFGIVSAASDSLKLTPEGISENNRRDRLMKMMLRKFEIGYIRLKGIWKNQEVDRYLTEKSVFIPYAKEEDVQAIADLFDQDSYVFGQNGFFTIKKTDGSATYLSGKIKNYLRQTSKDEIKDITENSSRSSLPGASISKGRGFVFDDSKINKSIPKEIAV